MVSHVICTWPMDMHMASYRYYYTYMEDTEDESTFSDTLIAVHEESAGRNLDMADGK